MINTRMAFARFFAALAVVFLPLGERHCVGLGLEFLDALKMRAHTIGPKGRIGKQNDKRHRCD